MYVKHGSFPSLCIGDNLGTVLEYNNYILCDYIKDVNINLVKYIGMPCTVKNT